MASGPQAADQGGGPGAGASRSPDAPGAVDAPPPEVGLATGLAVALSCRHSETRDFEGLFEGARPW